MSPSGPNMTITTGKTPNDKSAANPMVENMKAANCRKNCVCPKNMKKDAPSVVAAPDMIDTPIFPRVSLDLGFLGP